MKKKSTQNHDEIDPGNGIDHENEKETPFKEGVDICQQLMDRYSKSSAPQHRHLLAAAAAMRSILSSESLPLSPSAYFAAAISALDESETLDATAIGALLTFLSIVLPMIPQHGIACEKAKEAVEVMAGLVGKEGLGVASVRGAVKCLGMLLVGFCDLEDWNSVRLGLETLLSFSVYKRPKVRRCAQECLEKVFKSFSHCNVLKEASKLVLSLFKKHMPVAVTLSTAQTGYDSKDEMSLRPEDLEVLHILNVLKVTVPFLSVKVSSKILSNICKLISSEFSPLTRHIFKTIEVFFGISQFDAGVMEAENFVVCLASYVSKREKNPVDTLISAATLLKSLLDKLHARESSSWIRNLSLVSCSVAGLLTSEVKTAAQASVVVKDLINHHIDLPASLIDENHSSDDDFHGSEEADAIKSICSVFENILCSSNGIPNEHLLAVLSVLFQKLGKSSFIFMKVILLKLADLVTVASGDSSDTSRLQNCIGSAVIAMGPQRILTLLPISPNPNDLLSSNMWLVPILKDYVVGASIGYYMEHIVPLAKSFEQVSHKVKKSIKGQDLQAHAHGLWGLLPSFCRYSTDTHKKFGPLAELLISLLKNDSSMHEDIAVALQILVNQNKNVLRSEKDTLELDTFQLKDSMIDLRSRSSYSQKTATRNIKSLQSCSAELLQSLTDAFFQSHPAKRSYIKDAIRCLASITDSSVTKKIFMSLLEKFQFMTCEGEFEMQKDNTNESVDDEQGNVNSKEKDLQRCIITELASSLVEGAKEDLIHLIYDFIKFTFQENNEIGHHEAYITLGRILEKHAWFCSSKSVELIDLLLGLKPPVDVASLRSRFECLHVLMVHMLKMCSEEESTKSFLILNEIILMLKDGNEEHRKAAFDVLQKMSSSLTRYSQISSDAPDHKLISMIMGYLSGSSPHITSGAVSALSVLLYNDPEMCLQIPDLISSLLSLLQMKSLEVIKAVLGFVKVLVSSLQAKDLHNLLPEVISGVLPWSTVSRNHFRSKVTVILEIMIRKCGTAAVQLATPEKYKSFVRTVLENRHGKTSSKDAGTNNTDMLLADSETKGLQRRKQKELGILSKEKGSTEHRKRKRENRDNDKLTDSSKLRVSAGGGVGLKMEKRARQFDKSTEYQSDGRKTRNKRNFKKGPPNGRRKMEKANIGKKDNRAGRKPFPKVRKASQG
ncbi:hypothetical protein SLA2020_016090 [Shorea laevis]